MKNKTHFQNVESKPLKASASVAAKVSNTTEIGFTPSPGEVAKRAHAVYVYGGSVPGNDVRNWLDAEIQLRTEHGQPHGHGQYTQA